VLLDGCFYVDLHDCPSDVFYLLTALYDGLWGFILNKTASTTDRPLYYGF
jgi:hypothetical protein